MASKLASVIKFTSHILLNIFFPPFCAGCGMEGKYVCEKCGVFAGEAALICPASSAGRLECGESSFTGETHARCKTRYGLDGLANIWEYEGIVKEVLGTIKYKGITHAAGELVQRSFQAMIADQARFGTFLSFLLGGFPIITYVPMFLQKEKSRGFNQAHLVANEFAKLTKQKAVPLLEKIKNTSSQTNLTKEQRLENVKNSFVLQKQNLFSTIPEYVVLVDDIWTTGATMKECCAVLKKAGVKNVWGFTLARTV